MRNDTKTPPEKPPIDPAEYDFSDVPPAELESCMHYEYMRESEELIRDVKNHRHLSLEEIQQLRFQAGPSSRISVTSRKGYNWEDVLLQGAMEGILAASEEFPQVPWQKLSLPVKDLLKDLPARARKIHSALFVNAHPMLTINTLEKNPGLGRLTLETWKEQTRPKVVDLFTVLTGDKLLTTGFLQVNLIYKPKQLMEAFGAWLKVNHPEGNQRPKESRGRHSVYDKLIALGAMRLRYHCSSLAEAEKLVPPSAIKSRRMSFSHRSGWRKACEAAVRNFRSLLSLPDEALPIHYRKRRRK